MISVIEVEKMCKVGKIGTQFYLWSVVLIIVREHPTDGKEHYWWEHKLSLQPHRWQRVPWSDDKVREEKPQDSIKQLQWISKTCIPHKSLWKLLQRFHGGIFGIPELNIDQGSGIYLHESESSNYNQVNVWEKESMSNKENQKNGNSQILRWFLSSMEKLPLVSWGSLHTIHHRSQLLQFPKQHQFNKMAIIEYLGY